MKRKVINLNTMKTYDSIRQAETELDIYNITYNCQGKFDYVRQKGGNKIYQKWMYFEEYLKTLEK